MLLSQQMQAIAVIPTYNERENLTPLLDAIWEHAPWMHVLLVDDNSPDGTGQLADHLSRLDPDRLFVLHRKGKKGLGEAYKEAFRLPSLERYEFVLQMDADLSHDPAMLPELIETARATNADLVLGTRYLAGIRVLNWDFKRLLLSKCATRFVNVATGLPYTDVTGGLKCWRQSALRQIELDSIAARGYLFQIEMTFEAHRREWLIVEVPITFHERRLGMSKIDPAIIAEASWGVVRLAVKNMLNRFGKRQSLNSTKSPTRTAPAILPVRKHDGLQPPA